MRSGVIVLLAVGLATAACGGHQAAKGDEIRLCRTGEMHPLDVVQLRDALRARGFHPSIEPDEGICSASDVIAFLENGGDDESVFGCAVRAAPLYGVTPVLSVDRSPGRERYVVANVECSIYPEGDTRSDPKRFEQAMRRLLAVSQPITPREWKSVIRDSYDGKIDHPHRCAAVRAAYEHVPHDNTYATVPGVLLAFEKKVC
jgi:hypothetical protein